MTTTLEYAAPHTDPAAIAAAIAAVEAEGIPDSGVLVQLPPAWIVPDPDNERGAFTADEKFAELRASIAERGILEPLQVYQLAPQRFMLRSGHRRHAAATVLGLPTVPAIWYPVPRTEVDQALDRLASNIRADLDPVRRARTYATLLASGHLTQEQLAERAGCSQSAISRRLALLRLPEPVQALIADGKLTQEHGVELLKIKEPPLDYWGRQVRTVAEEQIGLAQEWARNTGSVDALRQRIDWNNDSRKQQVERMAREQAEREAATLEAQARQATAAQPPVADPAVAAKQAELAAQAAREAAAAARRADRLTERESWANGVLDQTLGYTPEGPPSLEMLRLAAALAANHSHLYDREQWFARIAEAPDAATVIRLLVDAARAALALDADKRALGNSYQEWALFQWVNARWGLEVRIADVLLDHKLINRSSHASLVAGKPKPADLPAPVIPVMPARGSGARACPLCGAAMEASGKGGQIWKCPACHTQAFLPMGLFIEHESVRKPTDAALAAYAALPAPAEAGATPAAASLPARDCPTCGRTLLPADDGSWYSCLGCDTVYSPGKLAVISELAV